MDFLSIGISLTILLFSAILHEVAHGYVADRLGDPTARLMGRLTLDPRRHIDPFMSILLPLMLIMSGSPVVIGAAKPVPVDEFNLKEGRKDMALVALAGPLTNLLIAIIASLIFRVFDSIIPGSPATFAMADFFAHVVQLNLLLAIFNLLPIPPLDGSKVFSLILPDQQARTYMSLGSIGMFVIFILLLTPIGGFSLSSFIGTLLRFTQGLLLP